MAIVRKGQPAITRILPHMQNRRIAAAQNMAPVKVLFTGDSWTDNTGFPDVCDYLPASVVGGFEWVNEGIAGSPLADISGAGSLEARISGELSTHNPDVVIITTAGINDGWVNTSPAALEAAAQSILDDCRAAGAVPVFVNPPMVSNYPGAAVANALQWRNDTLPAFCAANNLPQAGCRGILGDDSGIFAQYARDTSHLNKLGHDVLRQVIYQAIKVISSRAA